MKCAFRFFFHLIIGSALFFAIVYALGGRLIEEYNDIFSGAMAFIIAIAISGMVRHLVPEQPETKNEARVVNNQKSAFSNH